jgi:hypothetical protein
VFYAWEKVPYKGAFMIGRLGVQERIMRSKGLLKK